MAEWKKGFSLKEGVIILNRELTELDIFVKDFLDVLKKYSDYLVVSGYVSISTGRIRGTEDVDILIPLMGKDKFAALFDDLQNKRFWCYQGDKSEDVYSYLQKSTSIRFARVKEMFPNIEFIPFNQSNKVKTFEFRHPQLIRINGFEFKASPIEFEILYKEGILGSAKDIADAKHLRTFFSGVLKDEKFKEYGTIIEEEVRRIYGKKKSAPQ